MFIELDFNSNEAIYMQLRNQIILGIAQDKIKNGESLPSVRQLAEDIGVNMHTVNKAYALLRNDGYLKLDRRKGAVVCVTVEARKEQLARLKRACGRTPIVLSAASGEGVEAALRAVFAVVEEARAQEVKDEAPAQESGWHP